jgi:hypothetical protein
LITACLVKYCDSPSAETQYDKTVSFLRRFLPVIEYDNTSNNIGLVKARNILLKRVKTDAVLLCDFDIDIIGDVTDFDFSSMAEYSKFGIVSARVHKPQCNCDLGDYRFVKMPHLQNCFNVIQTKKLIDAGGYDERYHTYCADWDLIKRLDTPMYQYNAVNVIHYSESKKSDIRAELCKHDFIEYTMKWGTFERFPENTFICNAEGIC